MKKKKVTITFWKKIITVMFSQRTTIILLLIAQIMFLSFTLIGLDKHSNFTTSVLEILGIVLAVIILNKKGNPAYKLAWIIPLLAIPLFATIAYFLLTNQYSTKRLRNAHQKKCIDTKSYLKQNEEIVKKAKGEDKSFYRLSRYLDDFGGYPTWQNTTVKYFSTGMKKYKAMLEELEKAKKFIFLEYFIIDQGEMWSSIEEILIRKAKSGVDVRLMYDGMASQHLLPLRYDKKLNELGVKCHVFNPFRPLLSSIQNNRDHRKICVIDGDVAFNGGVNLADEYINRKERFGYWKDTAVMLKGDAVWNFTMMFLQMWEIVDENVNKYEKYKPTISYENKGFVIPFGDSPLDSEDVGQFVYLNMINHAKDYIYITTPYLVLNNEIVEALEFAAKSGVDVRIITPGIPDKKYCYTLAWSYYKELIPLGVKIYEFDGFIHAKNVVFDDHAAIVGTVNFDYRSLYLHFECATYMYKMECVKEIKNDFEKTLKKCRRITIEDCDKRSTIKKIASALLRIFAPLI